MARLGLILSTITALVALLGGFRYVVDTIREYRWRKRQTGKWLVVCLLCAAPSVVDASVITASSCSYADVNAALGSTSDGDILQIPGGTCTWASQLTPDKSITIQGVGAGTEAQCAVGGQTTYTCLNFTGPRLVWTTKSTGNTPAGFAMLKDITFDIASASGCATYWPAGVNVVGTSTKVRLTGLKVYYDSTCGGIIVGNSVTGVIDHNTIYAHSELSHGLVVLHDRWAGVGNYGDKSWASTLTFGSEDFVFVEDNIFDTDIAGTEVFYTDHHQGSRVVSRFNRIIEGSFNDHGTESGQRNRSALANETYRNHFSWSGVSNLSTTVSSRGGTMRAWDNYATGNLNKVIDFKTFRAGPAPHAQSTYSPWGYCKRQSVTLTRSGTTATATTASEHGLGTGYVTITGAADSNFNVTAAIITRINSTSYTYQVADTGSTSDSGTMQSPFDGNTDSAGYPCLDQSGRGPGDYLSGDETPYGDTISPKAQLNQVLVPILCWNNRDDGVVAACGPVGGTDAITANRDYYNYNENYVASPTTGIGVGARSSRPATCTAGTWWWATDQGSWNTSTTETYSALVGLASGADGVGDYCSATDTWTNAAYTPYTYPHPLTNGGTSPSPPILFIGWEAVMFVTALYHARNWVVAAVAAAVLWIAPVAHAGVQISVISCQIIKAAGKQAAVRSLLALISITKRVS